MRNILVKNEFVELELKDYVTLANALCGVLAITFANNYVAGFSLILLGAILDKLDGHIARKQGKHNELGKQLDSLSDVITFGVAPVMVTLMSGFSTLNLIAGSIFVACGIVRLARYNLQEERGVYFGLPIPLSALLLLLLYYFLPALGLVIMLVLSFAMISKFKIKKEELKKITGF